jgi:hypothetical protein
MDPLSSSFPANQAFLEGQGMRPDVPFMDPRVTPPVGELVAGAVMVGEGHAPLWQYLCPP